MLALLEAASCPVVVVLPVTSCPAWVRRVALRVGGSVGAPLLGTLSGFSFSLWGLGVGCLAVAFAFEAALVGLCAVLLCAVPSGSLLPSIPLVFFNLRSTIVGGTRGLGAVVGALSRLLPSVVLSSSVLTHVDLSKAALMSSSNVVESSQLCAEGVSSVATVSSSVSVAWLS